MTILFTLKRIATIVDLTELSLLYVVRSAIYITGTQITIMVAAAGNTMWPSSLIGWRYARSTATLQRLCQRLSPSVSRPTHPYNDTI